MSNAESNRAGMPGSDPFLRFLDRHGVIFEPRFDDSTLTAALQNPESNMTGRGFMSRVIKQLSSKPFRLDADTESEVAHFYQAGFYPVCKEAVSSLSKGQPITGTYTGARDGVYQWIRESDGTFEVLNGNISYRFNFSELKRRQGYVGTDMTVRVRRQDLQDLNYYLEFSPQKVKLDSYEVELPSYLAAKIWAAAATAVPLEVFFLADKPLVEFLDPEPTYMENILDSEVKDFVEAINIGFGTPDLDSGQAALPSNSPAGVAVLEKVESKENDSDISKIPLEVRKQSLKDIILVLHCHHKTELARQVVDYFNTHISRKIGEEIFYHPEQERGAVRVPDAIAPEGYTDASFDPVSYSIVEFVSLEPNQIRKSR